MEFPTNSVNPTYSRRARDRDSVTGMFRLIYVVKNGSSGLQNTQTVKFFRQRQISVTPTCCLSQVLM